MLNIDQLTGGSGIVVHNTSIYLKDLQKTQARLEKPFKMSLGEGVVGQWPSLLKIQDALQTKDGFMYCGHGYRCGVIRLPILYCMYTY